MIELAVLDAVTRLRAAGEPFLVATVVAVRGSSYRRPGARMVFTRDRWEAGSISGGCLERDLLRKGWWRLGEGGPVVVRYDASDDGGLGLGCGGSIDVLLDRDRGPGPGDPFTLFADCLRDQRPRVLETPYLVEPIEPPPRLFVCGAGHDAAPVAQLGRGLGWEVLSGEPDDCAARADASHRPLAIVMSHHVGRDREYLRALLPSRVRYLGVLGPRHRTRAILDELGRGDALDDPRVHAPAGLALGADAPAEIALAIVAEMQAALAGVAVESLRRRPGPIHPPAPRIGAAVLAAGASRRLGAPKQLLPFRGTTLLRAVTAEACAARADRVAVVLGAHAEAIAPSLAGLDVTIEPNPGWAEGLASSVRCAAAWAIREGCDGLVLLVGDQPEVDRGHLDRLIAAYRAERRSVASRYQGVLGVPAVFDRRDLDALLALRGDQGARAVLRAAPDAVAIDWAGGAVDVDTPEDSARLSGAAGDPACR